MVKLKRLLRSAKRRRKAGLAEPINGEALTFFSHSNRQSRVKVSARVGVTSRGADHAPAAPAEPAPTRRGFVCVGTGFATGDDSALSGFRWRGEIRCHPIPVVKRLPQPEVEREISAAKRGPLLARGELERRPLRSRFQCRREGECSAQGEQDQAQ
jgi:hypothetical protein